MSPNEAAMTQLPSGRGTRTGSTGGDAKPCETTSTSVSVERTKTCQPLGAFQLEERLR